MGKCVKLWRNLTKITQLLSGGAGTHVYAFLTPEFVSSITSSSTSYGVVIIMVMDTEIPTYINSIPNNDQALNPYPSTKISLRMVWNTIRANETWGFSGGTSRKCFVTYTWTYREEKSTFIPLKIFLSVCNVHNSYSQLVEGWERSRFYNDDRVSREKEIGSLNQPTMKTTSGLLIMGYNNISLFFKLGFSFTWAQIDYNL